jgi:hypothetical protein
LLKVGISKIKFIVLNNFCASMRLPFVGGEKQSMETFVPSKSIKNRCKKNSADAEQALNSQFLSQ